MKCLAAPSSATLSPLQLIYSAGPCLLRSFLDQELHPPLYKVTLLFIKERSKYGRMNVTLSAGAPTIHFGALEDTLAVSVQLVHRGEALMFVFELQHHRIVFSRPQEWWKLVHHKEKAWDRRRVHFSVGRHGPRLEQSVCLHIVWPLQCLTCLTQ